MKYLNIDLESLKQGIICIDGVILPQYNNGKGYFFVKNAMIKEYVHRIVATLLISNSDNKPQVNHINGNKSDNRVDNLEWCTQSENGKHAYKNGLNRISDFQKLRTAEATQGSKSNFAVLHESDIPIIKSLKKTGMINKDIAKIFNVHRETIGNIIRGNTWKHML